MIQGFRCTHYPNGASMSEYAPLTIMPMHGELKFEEKERASAYSHDREVALPHYYSVFLDDFQIQAELSAVSKAKFLQFTYPASEQVHIVLDNPVSTGFFRINPDANEIVGYTYDKARSGNKGYVGREFASYFVAKFNKPFDQYGVLPQPNTSSTYDLFPQGMEG